MVIDSDELLEYMRRWFDKYSQNLRAVGNDTATATHVIEGMQEGVKAVERYVNGEAS